MVCKRWSILLPSVSSVWPSRQLCFPTLPIPKVECSFVIAKMAFCSEILCRFSFLCVYNYLVKWFLWPLHATQQEQRLSCIFPDLLKRQTFLQVVAFLTEGIMLDQQGKTLGIDVCAEMNHSKITFLMVSYFSARFDLG